MSRPPSDDPRDAFAPPAEDLICYCFEVTEREIEAAIRILKLQTVEEINRVTRAGCGCHTCWPDLESILARCQAGDFRYELTPQDFQRFRPPGTPATRAE